MSFSLNRRINTGNGSSVNVSRSGVSVTQRTKWGSYGSRGFSIKTGIPGLNYRHSFKKKTDAATMGIYFLIAAMIFSAVIGWNLLRLAGWLGAKAFLLSAKAIEEINARRQLKS